MREVPCIRGNELLARLFPLFLRAALAGSIEMKYVAWNSKKGEIPDRELGIQVENRLFFAPQYAFFFFMFNANEQRQQHKRTRFDIFFSGQLSYTDHENEAIFKWL